VALCACSVGSVSKIGPACTAAVATLVAATLWRTDCMAQFPVLATPLFNTEPTEQAQRATEFLNKAATMTILTARA
jgi:hypothetical protein